jgi:hypothetical protein
MDRKTLIEQTIDAITETLANLEMDRDRIEFDMNQKKGLLDTWRKELAQIEKGKPRNRERAPKGEALRLIHEWYDRDPRSQQNGLTIKQISDATGMNWSTVRNVVKKPENGFIETDGRIRRSPEAERLRAARNAVPKPRVVNGAPLPQR